MFATPCQLSTAGFFSGLLAVLPDGRLASASADAAIRIWDLGSRTDPAVLSGHEAPVLALAALPDGQLASGAQENAIRLWNVKSGTEIGRLVGHTDWPKALAVLRDGKVASASYDSTVRLWDPSSGRELCCLQLDAPVLSLAALTDGRLIAGDRLGRLHRLQIVE